MTDAPAEVRDAWQRAVEQWDDAARHEVVLVAVTRTSSFAWAAARYKERAGDAIADRQLERVRLAAVATMMSGAAKRPERKTMPYKSSIAALAVIVVMIVIGLVYALVMDRAAVPPVSGGVISK